MNAFLLRVVMGTSWEKKEARLLLSEFSAAVPWGPGAGAEPRTELPQFLPADTECAPCQCGAKAGTCALAQSPLFREGLERWFPHQHKSQRPTWHP